MIVHSRTRELVAQLDLSHADLKTAVDMIPLSERGWRPAPGRWSAAEIVDHLALVEKRIAKLMSAQIAAAREAGLRQESDDSSVMGMMRMDRLLDRRRPLTSSEASQPREGVDANTAWTDFETANLSIREAVAAGDGMALGDITVPHPVLGPLNLYQWVLFVGGHESRHAIQIREIAQALSGRVRQAAT
jgi:hypothetical protein